MKTNFDDKNLKQKFGIYTRLNLAEMLKAQSLAAKCFKVAASKAVCLPQALLKKSPLTPAALQVLPKLCEKAEQSLAHWADEVAGGYKIEGLPDPAKWIGTKIVDPVDRFLTPARLLAAVEAVGEILRMVDDLAVRDKRLALAPAL